MKIGDLVKHKTTHKPGKIASFMKRYPIALVCYSDETGVLFRWVRIVDLEAV